jgi:hypothetical protein
MGSAGLPPARRARPAPAARPARPSSRNAWRAEGIREDLRAGGAVTR